MVTISVTRYRTVAVLNAAADKVADEAWGWEPLRQPLMRAIDEAAGYSTPGVDQAAEDTTLLAYDAICEHVAFPVGEWEQTPGLTAADVAEAMREAAKAVA